MSVRSLGLIVSCADDGLPPAKIELIRPLARFVGATLAIRAGHRLAGCAKVSVSTITTP
jgi:hypothetical protein